MRGGPRSFDDLNLAASGSSEARRPDATPPPAAAASVEVLVADDDSSIRSALAELVSSDRSLELVGVASDADTAIELAARHRPTVALIDVRMPGGGGRRAAREIRRHSPKTQVVAVSGDDDRATVLDMISAGAVGYIVKGSQVDDILEAIKRSAAGRSALSPEVAREVISHLGRQLSKERHDQEVRQAIRAGVREVIDDGGPRMVFQPIACLRTGRAAGVEALARFDREPVRPPNLWFDEAGCVGLRTALEVAAARSAISQLDRLPPSVYLAINLSPGAAVVPALQRVLASAPVDRLVLEVTEEAPVEDYEALAEALAGPRGAGLRLAVDDAGAGFASLRHILRLSPDLIKLDVSLTRDIHSDRARRALASALISFAGETDANIVAEGIETAEELTTLDALGVRYGQGYYLGRPGPLS